MHTSETDIRHSTPATVLALVLLGTLATNGWQVLQQVRMAPGTLMSAPALPLATHTPDTPPAGTAPAQTAGPGWEALNTPQKLALYPLAGRWNLLSELQKRKWLVLAQSFPSLPSQEQDRLHERMTEWASLSVQQRNQARLNYAVTKRLAPDDRRTQWDAYQALSDEDKRKLAAANATPKLQGAATALLPVSPKKLAKVPAAINAQGNPANPPKIPPPSTPMSRTMPPPALQTENRGAEMPSAGDTAPPPNPGNMPASNAPAPAAVTPPDPLPNPYLN